MPARRDRPARRTRASARGSARTPNAWREHRRSDLLLSQMLGQQIEALAPTAKVSVARAGGFEAGLLERDPGPVAEILEPHRHEGFVPRYAVLFPGMRHHQKLARHDLAVDAAEPEVMAFGRAH